MDIRRRKRQNGKELNWRTNKKQNGEKLFSILPMYCIFAYNITINSMQHSGQGSAHPPICLGFEIGAIFS